ncbi:MAG: DUF427 domain-containing protein [Acidimicrobiales bacterium]
MTNVKGLFPGLPEPHVEPSARWVRVRAADTWVADTRDALLLVWYGPGKLPTYCFPERDVRTDLFRPSEPGSYDLLVGGEVWPGVASRFRDPPRALAALDGYWTFTWDGRLRWFEEAMEVHVHARDPTKRVDTVPSERRVRVEVAGEVIAESSRAHALFETHLPTRWYLPAEDVRMDRLVPTDTVTRCPYKGTARYWSVHAGGEVHDDIAWSYAEPIPECPRIAGLICFFNERVDLVIDGVRQERPQSPWS